MITHIIRKTDTLEGIAVRYNVPIAKIKKANKIYSKSVLMCMEKILIPEEDDILSPNTPSSSKGNQPDINITTIPNNFNNNNSQQGSIYNGSVSSFSLNNYSMNSASPTLYPSETNNTISSIKTIEQDNVSCASSTRRDFKRSTSEISNLSEFFETIDRNVMETVNKSNISLPLLIKSQLEVYQDIPTYDPTKDPKNNTNNTYNNNLTTNNINNGNMQKSYSMGCFNNGNNRHMHTHSTDDTLVNGNDPKNLMKKLYRNSNSNSSQSSLPCSFDGYNPHDFDFSPNTEPRKSFLKSEHEKVNKIFEKLSISTNMDGIQKMVSRLSSREFSSSLTTSDPTNPSSTKHSNDYLELAKIF